MAIAWRTIGTILAFVVVLTLAVRIGAIEFSVMVAVLGAFVITTMWRVFVSRRAADRTPAAAGR